MGAYRWENLKDLSSGTIGSIESAFYLAGARLSFLARGALLWQGRQGRLNSASICRGAAFFEFWLKSDPDAGTIEGR
jgi:hypothetical protein